MPNAVLFSDPLEFCEFVRMHGAGAKPTLKDGFELLTYTDPLHPGRTALALIGFRRPRLGRFSGTGFQVEKARVADDGILQIGTGKRSAKAQLLGLNRKASLLEFISVVPWKQPVDPCAGHVVFWVRDPHALPVLIRDSLRLNNDRVQFYPLDSERSGETLVRIESPSYYLIQRCLEDEGGAVGVFRPMSADLYVRWGFEHPLADLIVAARGNRDGADPELDLVFFTGGSEHRHVAAVPWTDAYQLADFRFDFEVGERLLRASADPPKFDVPLRLTRQVQGGVEPELWLLGEEGLDRLERLLGIVDEEQLRPYLMATTDSNRGGDFVFVREKRLGSKRLHLDFGGTAFARFAGITNLLLPAGYALTPPLRRDLYRGLFDLDPAHITVLIPEEGGSEYSIIRIPEAAFTPLSSAVDYIVDRDAETLKSRISESIFDLGAYANAPSRAGLPAATGEMRQRESRKPLKKIEEPEILEKEPEKAELSLKEFLREEGVFDEMELGELQREELRLEREIVEKGQGVNRWRQLLICKSHLDKFEEAAVCAVEGLWLAEDQEIAKPFEDALDQFSQVLFGSTAGVLAADLHENDAQLRLAAYCIANDCPDASRGGGALSAWVAESTAFLERYGPGLRIKERWLAWVQVLRKNRDERRQAALREEIRSDICNGRVGLEETPAFIRTHIFVDSNRESHDESAGESGVEHSMANLAALQGVCADIEVGKLGGVLRALIARASARIGNIGMALELVEREWGRTNPYSSLFHLHTLEKVGPERASELRDRLDDQLDDAEPAVRSAIQEMGEQYEVRERIDSPAAFLAQENLRRTYPSGDGHKTGELFRLISELEMHCNGGDEKAAVRTIREMLTLEEKKDYDDYVKLPQFVEAIVAGLERFKWGDRGASLLPLFENFAQRAPGFLSQRHGFYATLLHTNLCDGLLVAENLEAALAQIKRAINCIGGVGDLDLIDGSSGIICSVDQLPLEHRLEPLRTVASMLARKFDNTGNSFIEQPRLFIALVKVFEQLVEAAISRDRISLEMFRSYQLHDEFVILQRVQRESPATAIE